MTDHTPAPDSETLRKLLDESRQDHLGSDDELIALAPTLAADLIATREALGKAMAENERLREEVHLRRDLTNHHDGSCPYCTPPRA